MHIYPAFAARCLIAKQWVIRLLLAVSRLIGKTAPPSELRRGICLSIASLRAPRSRRRLVAKMAHHATVYAAIGATLVLGMPASNYGAGPYYWDGDGNVSGDNATTGAGLGGNGIWNTSSPLWWDGTNPLTAWTNPSSAIFSGAGGAVLLGTAINIDALTFNSSGFFLTGNGTAGSNILTLGGSGLITLNTAGTNSISAILAGTSGLNLTSSSTGTLLLSGANTIQGTISISSGTLGIYSDANLGNANNGITFTGAAGGLSLFGPVVLNANRTITLNNSAAITITAATNDPQAILGKVTGAGNFNIVNTGTTYL
jgi:fibronectin-binding autotransporter adhesin